MQTSLRNCAGTIHACRRHLFTCVESYITWVREQASQHSDVAGLCLSRLLLHRRVHSILSWLAQSSGSSAQRSLRLCTWSRYYNVTWVMCCRWHACGSGECAVLSINLAHQWGGAMTPAPTRKCLRLVMSFPSDSTPRGPALRAREQALEPESELQPESDLEDSSHLDPSYLSPTDLSSPDISSPKLSSPGLSSPGLSSSPDSAPHLAFAPVALAQYHDIAEKLASNNIFRILRSPAPVRVWVYRALLAETRAWDKWNREAIEGA